MKPLSLSYGVINKNVSHLMDYITQVGEMACYHRLKCLQFMYIYTPNKIPTNSTDDSVFMHFTLS